MFIQVGWLVGLSVGQCSYTGTWLVGWLVGSLSVGWLQVPGSGHRTS